MAILGDIIDRGLAAARPAAGTEGRLYFSTDTEVLERDSGAAWETYGGGSGGAPWWACEATSFCVSRIAMKQGASWYHGQNFNLITGSSDGSGGTIMKGIHNRVYDLTPVANTPFGYYLAPAAWGLAPVHWFTYCDTYAATMMGTEGITDLTLWFAICSPSNTTFNQHTVLGEPYSSPATDSYLAGFQARGVTDANIQFVTGYWDGSAWQKSTTDTGIAFSANTEYLLEIIYDATAGTWKGAINGDVVATHTRGVENVPDDHTHTTTSAYSDIQLAMGNHNTGSPGSTQRFGVQTLAWLFRQAGVTGYAG